MVMIVLPYLATACAMQVVVCPMLVPISNILGGLVSCMGNLSSRILRTCCGAVLRRRSPSPDLGHWAPVASGLSQRWKRSRQGWYDGMPYRDRLVRICRTPAGTRNSL